MPCEAFCGYAVHPFDEALPRRYHISFSNFWTSVSAICTGNTIRFLPEGFV